MVSLYFQPNEETEQDHVEDAYNSRVSIQGLPHLFFSKVSDVFQLTVFPIQYEYGSIPRVLYILLIETY